ncbi:aspartyl-phosphate phosphatase Spo0E family protein [Cytobacillus sp. FSL H8-0458]|uniref:aspartyl-phosphate phosphatase Spo0E family protein n=1 Tax=Cytobacillus sp. FSL H8-0458 TaxID=2975346 RepID=UPI0040469779
MCKEDLIEIARSKMINSIRKNGFLSKKTIQLSQELDVYIWEQQKQKINTKFLKKK